MVTHLEWTAAGDQLYSWSYDGTVRMMDVEAQVWRQVFAPYTKDDKEQAGNCGYGLDKSDEKNCWLQYGCLDKVNVGAMYITTSIGQVYHVDTRANVLTFNKNLHDKKVNSLSMHPNGCVISCLCAFFSIMYRACT